MVAQDTTAARLGSLSNAETFAALEDRVATSNSKDSVDIMNDPQFETNSGGVEDGNGEADTCRICRGEGTAKEPLFYPCKCSGSIKFVHQDCLMEWLSHSQKKHCELCKTSFRFTKLYSPSMPQTLPTHVFFRHLIIHAAKNVAIWLRACLVVFVWLGVLPWLMRHIWGLLFWFGDGGWTSQSTGVRSNSTSATEALLLAGERLAKLSINATSPASPIMASSTTSANVAKVLDQLPKITLDWSSYDPLASSFLKFIYYGLGLNTSVQEVSTPAMSNVSQTAGNQLASAMSRSSVLSGVNFLKNLTRYPKLNSVLITTLEGQIITVVVVVCFVLIFLIREWVVQQQPGINMGIGFNAEPAGRNAVAQREPLADLQVPAHDPEAAADDNERRVRVIARPRRRQVRFEDIPANEREEGIALPVGHSQATLPTTASDESGISSSTAPIDLFSTVKGDLSDTHLDAAQFVEVWRRGGGNPEEVLRIIEAEDLGEKLRYWKTHLKSLRERQTHLATASDLLGIDDVTTAGIDGPNADPKEDGSSSGSWIDIPDITYDDVVHKTPSSSQEDDTVVVESKKGKEKATADEMPLKSTTYLNNKDPTSHTWTAEELSEMDEGSQNSKPMLSPTSGRPRANTDGPKVQGSISPLGNNSWTFSNLSKVSSVDKDVSEPESPLVSWKAEQDLRVQQAVMKGIEARSPGQDQSTSPIDPVQSGSPLESWRAEKDRRLRQKLKNMEAETPEQDRLNLSQSPPRRILPYLAPDNDPIELFNPETGSTTTAENWDEIFTRGRVEGSDDEESQPPGEETNNPFHPDGLLPEDAHVLEPRQPTAPPQQDNLGLLGNIADWLWGDAPDDRDVPAGDDEHIVHDLAAEAPFVPVIHNVQNMMVDVNDEEPNRDRDRELVEALAGIDLADPDGLDAIDDAEDFEGIMELVGMRGPLTQLFQNGLFSAVLISLTVACGVWMPYNFGRLFLLLIANPMRTIKMPLKLLFGLAAVLQDLGLVLLGCISYACIKIFSFFRASSPTSGPPNFATELSNWSGAPYEVIGMANSALERIVDLTISSLVQITASEVPAFSAMSHEALIHIKAVISGILRYIGTIATTVIGSPAESMQLFGLTSTSNDARSIALNVGRLSRQYLIDLGYALSSADTWVMTLDSPRRNTPVDPILSYWGGTDRFWAIVAGYVALSFVGAAYLRRGSPFSTSQAGRDWEATIVDILNQAGGVMKVILIISIEMLVFPLYCGLLLDLALLPLFENATILSRIIFTIDTPFTSIFVHWFVGTCYMFHFALFVSMCRKIMRPGVLYFIRDPDDPTFHPVRDVLERNVATQLKKITFSAMVYGALVLVCLGGVVWSLELAFNGVLPIHWSSNEPVLQFPIDLLFYNFFMPLAVKFFKPSDGLHAMYSWWFRKCARILRLTWFLFNRQMPDEEGRQNRKGWDRLIGSVREGFLELLRPEYGPDIEEELEFTFDENFQRDGQYVRTPASDQVRIPKGQQVFIEVDENNHRVDGKPESTDASSDDTYQRVYIPPAFRTRIFLFILFIWLFAAVTGVCITIVPLVFGRLVFAKIIPTHVRKNDVYAFAIGSYILGSVLYCVVHLREGISYLRSVFAVNEHTPKMAVQKISAFSLRSVRVLYAYIAFAFILPTLLTLTVEFYFIIPLHTYFSPNEAHVIHFVQSWTLGLLYLKIGTHLILWHSDSRPAEALRAMTRNGYLDPDIRIATRAFILPATVVLSLALTIPLCVAAGANKAELFGTDVEIQKRVYRYAYPFTMSTVVHLMGVWTILGVMKGWQMKIRDEVYLIGERLHNFGDRSKSGAGALIPTGSRIET